MSHVGVRRPLVCPKRSRYSSKALPDGICESIVFRALNPAGWRRESGVATGIRSQTLIRLILANQDALCQHEIGHELRQFLQDAYDPGKTAALAVLLKAELAARLDTLLQAKLLLASLHEQIFMNVQ